MSALLNISGVEIIHPEFEFVDFVGSQDHSVSKHSLLTKDIHIVALVGDRGRNVLRLFGLAEAEKIGLVPDCRQVTANRKLIAAGTPAFLVEVVAGDTQCAGAGLIRQREEIVQDFPGDGANAGLRYEPVCKHLARID